MDNEKSTLEVTQTATAEAATQTNAHDTSAEKPKRSKLQRARRACILIIFLSIIVGLLLKLGWGTLCSLGVDAVAYLCPLGALETLLAGHELVPRLIIAFICVVILVALLGRIFCSWVCVVPPLRRFFHPKEGDTHAKKHVVKDKAADTEHDDAAESVEGDSHPAEVAEGAASPVLQHGCTACSGCAAGSAHEHGESSHRPLPPIGGKRDGLQIDTRHGVLAGALVSSLICGFPVFCLICPVGLSIALVVGIYSAIFEQNPTVSILIFIAILLIELAFFRKWCHKICPIGAFMSLVGVKAPLLKPRVDHKKCLREKGADCRVCVEVCPEQLDPHSKSIPECTKCGICIEKCPSKAISFKKPQSLKDPAA